jgi:PAS domain S-box-containing protein
MTVPDRPFPKGFGVVVMCIALAMSLALLVLGNGFPFLLAAVTIAAWYGGPKLSLPLTFLILALLFVSVRRSRPETGFVETRHLLNFAVLALLVNGLTEALHATRRRVEADARTLLESERQFRRLYESNPHPMWVFDPETLAFRSVNEAAIRRYGYSREEFLSMTVAEIRPPEDVPRLRERLEREKASPYTDDGTWRHLKKDGTPIDVEISTNSIEFEGRLARVVLAHDITERKRADEALRFLAEAGTVLASSLDYEATLDAVAHLAVPHLADMCLVDLRQDDGTIRRVAAAHSDPAKQALADELRRRHPPEPDGPHPAMRVMRTGQPEMVNEVADELLVATTRDADHLAIVRRLGFKSFMLVPLAARGRTLGVISLIGTETNRRYGPSDLALAEGLASRAALAIDNAQHHVAAQTARREAEAANSAKDQFLAVLSHELRTPLTPVLASTSAMLEDPETPPEVRPALEMTRRNIELEARLIDDLLDVTRISQGKMRLEPEVVDAHALIHRALSICRSDLHAGALQLDLDLAAGEHHVEADPARLQQVFWNLIKNAVKFTPVGGTIALRSHNRDSPEGRRLVVEVRDTGVGIEPGLLPRIFDAFEQGEAALMRRFGGLGLGLAICRSVVKAHGGQLSAASPGKGQGATFILELAVVGATATRAATTGGFSSSRRAALKILLVEDNVDTLRVVGRLLRRRDYVVVQAECVAAALKAADESDFDLVVCDIGLPDGSGLDLIRQLMARRPVKAIALSGFGMDEDLRRSEEAGFMAHMTKPVDFSKLEAMIQRVASAL